MEEKIKEEVTKKLETAEQNRERLIQERLEMLKKHVSNIILHIIFNILQITTFKIMKLLYLCNLDLN